MTATTGKKARYFYGWNIVIASVLAEVPFVEHMSSTLGLFFKPLREEFGWSRSALAGVQTVGRVVEAASAFAIGGLVDRFGPRWLMPIGAVILALAMFLSAHVTGIWQFYLFRGVVAAIGFTFIGPVVTRVAINKWFVQKRGRTIAITATAQQVAAVALVPIIVFVMASSGWRVVFYMFSGVALVFAMLPPIFLMRRCPEDMGLHPDGIRISSDENGNLRKEGQLPLANRTLLAPEPVWSRREALMTAPFWLFAVSFGIDSLAYQGINISLAPFLQDLGYGTAMVSAVLTFRFVIQSGGSAFAGFLAEHAHKLAFRALPLVLQCVGTFLFLFAKSPALLWSALILYCGGQSAFAVMQEVLWANYFGRQSLGAVRSMAYMISFGLGAAGPVAMNLVFDITGSYTPAFIAAAVFTGISVFLMVAARPAKAKRYVTAA